MKKFLALLLAAMMVLALVACGAPAQNDTPETPDEDGDAAPAAAKVFMSISLGGLGDQGYNDSAYAGAKKAEEELGIQLDVYEPTSIAEIEAQMMTVAASGEYDLILGIGADNASAVEKAGVARQMSHISTGGGASLEFLEGLSLPGIACLQDN